MRGKAGSKSGVTKMKAAMTVNMKMINIQNATESFLTRSLAAIFAILVGYVSFFSIILFSVSGSAAEENLPSASPAFIATRCGKVLDAQAVASVCYGRLAGEPDNSRGAFRFTMVNGATYVFRVTGVSRVALFVTTKGPTKARIHMVSLGDESAEYSIDTVVTPEPTGRRMTDLECTFNGDSFFVPELVAQTMSATTARTL